MAKFSVDAPKKKMISVGTTWIVIQREREHIAMVRENQDGTRTRLTMPNHSTIKSSTLRTICKEAGISRDEFISAYNK